MLCLSLGCTSDNSNVPPEILPSIDDEFTIQLWEHLNPDENTLSLIVETIENEDCTNNLIQNEVTIRDTKLVVNLEDIEKADNCIEGEGPASADISFTSLENGIYDLEINLLSVIKNEGFIEISPDNLNLELTSREGILVINNELKRVPNNTFWGYIALDNSQLNNVSSTFLESIEIIKDNFDFAQGNYGHFSISEENGTVDFDAPTAFPDLDKFVFKHSGDLSILTTLLNEYRMNEEYMDKLEIRVFTYQGLEL